MNVLVYLIPISLLLGGLGLLRFSGRSARANMMTPKAMLGAS